MPTMPTTLSLSPLPVEGTLYAEEEMAHLANPSHVTSHVIGRTSQTVFQLYCNIYPSNHQGLMIDVGSMNRAHAHHSQMASFTINDSLLVELTFVQQTNSGEVYHLLPASTPKKKERGLRFDEANIRFIVDGKPIPQTHLTDLEHRLLKYLYKNAEKVCSYRNIAKHVWHGWARDNTITQRICKLGQKLNQISPGAKERYLKTSQGYVRGYMLTCEA